MSVILMMNGNAMKTNIMSLITSNSCGNTVTSINSIFEEIKEEGLKPLTSDFQELFDENLSFRDDEFVRLIEWLNQHGVSSYQAFTNEDDSKTVKMYVVGADDAEMYATIAFNDASECQVKSVMVSNVNTASTCGSMRSKLNEMLQFSNKKVMKSTNIFESEQTMNEVLSWITKENIQNYQVKEISNEGAKVTYNNGGKVTFKFNNKCQIVADASYSNIWDCTLCKADFVVSSSSRCNGYNCFTSLESANCGDITADVDTGFVTYTVEANTYGSSSVCNCSYLHCEPPTPSPTPDPTPLPTPLPTPEPTPAPSPAPSLAPSTGPTSSPTVKPTKNPTPAPTKNPTSVPTSKPTKTPTPAPTPAPTGCFSDESFVYVPDNNNGIMKKSIKEIRLYDKILSRDVYTNEIFWDEIIYASHYLNEDGGNDIINMLSLYYNDNDYITLSNHHLIYKYDNKETTLVPADNVNIGDYVYLYNSNVVQVQSIEHTTSKKRAIFTKSGNVVVNNVVASSYTGKSHYEHTIQHYITNVVYSVVTTVRPNITQQEMMMVGNFVYYQLLKPFISIISSLQNLLFSVLDLYSM